jgi:hypothetical protein
MSIVQRIEDVIHRHKVWLRPNYLPTAADGELVAQSVNEKTLELAQICSSLKERGGSTATYDDLVAHGEGVWFVNPATSERVNVDELNDNRPKTLRGLIPASLAAGRWTIEVVTRYTAATDNLLKEPRTIVLPYPLDCIVRQSSSPKDSPSPSVNP